MGLLIQPKRWTTKPSLGTQINWGHPLAQGLVGCWLSNEDGGLILNDSLGLAKGTLSGSTLPVWSSSSYSRFLKFDGSSSYVNVALSAPLLTLSGQMTVLAVMNSATIGDGSRQEIVSTTKSPSAGSAFSLLAGRTVANKITFQAPSNLLGNTAITNNAWYQIVGVRSGTTGNFTAALYVNGVNDGTIATTDPASVSVLSIGRQGDFNQFYFNGYIGQVILWNRPLSASEVQWLYVEPYAFMQPPSPRRFSPPPLQEGYLFHYHR